MIKRKGTIKLLQLTKKLDEKDKNEILKYISKLENSEKEMFNAIKIIAEKFKINT